jgi:hypothetical protein
MTFVYPLDVYRVLKYAVLNGIAFVEVPTGADAVA